ncbi:MAG: FecCD family ABC transporter permease [Candidatus Syntropharchaeia archaeon]
MKRESSEEEFKNKRPNVRKSIFIFCLLFLLLFITAFSVTLGPFPITVTEVYSIILQGLFQNPETKHEMVVWEIRMPRMLMGIVAGIALGLAGTIMQGVLKNPLASPYTLGIVSSAGFGTVLAIFLGAGVIRGHFFILGIAFIFALITSLFILYLANRIGVTPFGIVVITVVGIAIMWLFAPLNTLVLYFSEAEAIKEAYFWMVGSLGRASWADLLPTFVILSVCCFLLLIIVLILRYKYKSWDFSAIEIGANTNEDQRKEIKRIRTFLMAIAALLVATTVSFTGAIAFIGLVAPHIAYKTVGKDNRFLLIVSALLGALILVGADTLARTIMAPVIVPVGVITSLIGVPLFIYLLMKIIIHLTR